jgi:hypothetical protein
MRNARKEMFDSVVPGMLESLLGDVAVNAPALALVTSQLYSYETRVYEPRRTPLLYQRLIPIDYSDGEGSIGRAYTIMDIRGETKEIARGSDDMPLVDVAGSDVYIPFKIGGAGYSYDTEDLRQAANLNFNRVALMPQAAFNIYERAINEHALFGVKRWGKLGFKESLFVNSRVGIIPAPYSYENATGDQLIAIFNEAINAVYDQSNNTSYADTIAAPSGLIARAEQMPLNEFAADTVLGFVRRTNKTTMETGRQLNIIGVRGLEVAGENDVPRLMAYEMNPENLVLPLPMPFRFLPPQIRNLTFVVPGEYKYGPVHVRYPKSAVYMDFPALTGAQQALEARRNKELGEGKPESTSHRDQKHSETAAARK